MPQAHVRQAGRLTAAESVPCIWIVDDDEAVRLAVSLLIQSEGWECRAFASGEQFLESYSPGTTDCLVLDLQMPGMTGADLLEILRQRNVALPAIVITAFPENGLATRSRAAGARAVLGKPFNADDLLAEIRRVLE